MALGTILGNLTTWPTNATANTMPVMIRTGSGTEVAPKKGAVIKNAPMRNALKKKTVINCKRLGSESPGMPVVCSNNRPSML